MAAIKTARGAKLHISATEQFLTRIGADVRVVINGDPRQTDIAASPRLRDAAGRLQHLDNVAIHDSTLPMSCAAGYSPAYPGALQKGLTGRIHRQEPGQSRPLIDRPSRAGGSAMCGFSRGRLTATLLSSARGTPATCLVAACMNMILINTAAIAAL